MDNIDKFVQLVQESDNIVFFGGAGVSTESGIPDFRRESHAGKPYVGKSNAIK